MRRRDLLSVGLSYASIAALRSLPASAQGGYPDQPIRLIVPRAAGGVVDVVARLWADQMKSLLGTVVVEDQGRGGGTIAAALVARARPDGYTLLAGTTSELVIAPVIMSAPSYDPVRDLAPIVTTVVSVSALMVHESLPVHTLQELVTYARANPGKLSYGSAGVGTSSHLCGEQFKRLAGLPDIVQVPYKGANPGWSISMPGISRCLPPASRPRCSTCIGPGRFGFWWPAPTGVSRARRIFRSARMPAFPISSR
jgi:tripartite-type tricarboxylate transporter receptor subunit TctC